MKTQLFFLITTLNFISTIAFAQLGYTGFEKFKDETVFTKTSWASEGFTVPWVNGFDVNRAYVDNAFAHSGLMSLRIKYPTGSFGPTNSGAQAPLTVTPSSQLYM